MADNTHDRPTLSTFRDYLIRETALRVRTVVPARVLEYHDGPPSTAKLEISAQQVERDRDGNEGVRQPFIVDDVPVWQMGGTQSYIRLPLQTGDEGVILVCDRSIGSWRTDGLAHPPPAPWIANLGECVFLPGFRPDAPAYQPLPATMGGAVVEAQTLQLGIAALLGAARTTDPVAASAEMAAFASAISAAFTALGAIPTNAPAAAACAAVAPLQAAAMAQIGAILSGSTKTFIE